jgi:hypothetical protein
VIEYDARTRSTSPAVVGDRLLVLHLGGVLGVDAEVGDEQLGDLDVEAARDVVVRTLEAEARLVVLHADGDLAGVGQLLHLGAGLELRGRVLLRLDVAALALAVAGVAAGRQRQGQAHGGERRLGADESHVFSFCAGSEDPTPVKTPEFSA